MEVGGGGYPCRQSPRGAQMGGKIGVLNKKNYFLGERSFKFTHTTEMIFSKCSWKFTFFGSAGHCDYSLHT